MKLEFVIFDMDKKKAEFLWNKGVEILQFFGFNVTGDVSEYVEEDLDEINRMFTDAAILDSEDEEYYYYDDEDAAYPFDLYSD